MGCGNSQEQNDHTQMPNKLKNKKTKDYDELMGNIVPSQLVDEDNSKKTKKQIAETMFTNDEEDDDKNQNKDNKQRKKVKAMGKFRGAEDTEDQNEKVEKKQRKMKQSDQQLIVKSLSKSSLFYQLSDADLEFIVRSMFYCEVAKDQLVFQQGDQASTYFILDQGEIEVIIDGSARKKLGPGTGFGELALLYNAPRSATIKCLVNCGFWAIDRGTFRKTVEELVQKELPTNRGFMESVSFFNFMNPEQKDAIAHGLINQKFQPGDHIVTEGDQADSFFMIKEGTVSIWKGNQELRKLGPKDSFGEQALYIQSQRMATVKCDTEVKVLSLGRDNITKILGDKVQFIVYNNLMRWAFDKCGYLKNLTKIQIERITQNAQISNYKAGQVVYNSQKPLDKLIIIMEGKIVKQTNQETVCEKGSLFGEHYLLKQNINKVIDDSIIMAGNGVIATIPINTFYKCIGGQLEEVLEKNKDSHELKMAAQEKKIDYSHIQLDHLIFIKKLGFGQFGSVYLVQNKDTKDLYALKGVMKGQIIEQHLEKHLILEKTVLEIINFPFIMTFYRTFKDEYSVYFLTKYIRGMELFDVIRDMGLLPTKDSQFFIGTMILAMEYMHSKAIVYRDLKPENIMVDSEGVMYIIDLGTAKILSKNKHHGRTFTIIGTPHYMAPEIFQGKGYTQAVDLWSIGCCLFEFMGGGVPFGEECDDPQDIYDEIMKGDVQFPQYMKDKKAKKLIEQLLNKVPELRLGGSYAALKAHMWFDNFDWDKLYNKELPKPYVPPNEKLISDQEMKQKIKEDIPVFNVIKEEQALLIKKYKKLKPTDPNWDADF